MAPSASRNDEIMTLAEISKYLKVSERSVLRMAQEGTLPAAKVASQWRFRRDAIDSWLTSRMEMTEDDALVDVIRTKKQPLTTIPHLLPKERCLLDLESGSRGTILEQLITPLADSGILRNPRRYLRRLLQREAMIPTALGNGIALPHARDPERTNATEDALVLGLCREGTDFGALDGEPTTIFVLICSTTVSEHLRLLAKTTLMLRLPGFADQLRQAVDYGDVQPLLRRAQTQLTIQI